MNTQGDAGAVSRNRKMFSLLQGTLKRARDEVDSKSLATQQQKLEKVETKLRTDRTKLLEYALHPARSLAHLLYPRNDG